MYLFLIKYNQDKCITIVIKLAMEFRYEHMQLAFESVVIRETSDCCKMLIHITCVVADTSDYMVWVGNGVLLYPAVNKGKRSSVRVYTRHISQYISGRRRPSTI